MAVLLWSDSATLSTLLTSVAMIAFLFCSVGVQLLIKCTLVKNLGFCGAALSCDLLTEVVLSTQSLDNQNKLIYPNI